MAVGCRQWREQVRAGNGIACNAAQRVSGTGVKRQTQAVAPIINVVADVGNGQNVSDHDGNYNQIHIEEVIDSKNNDHRK